MRTSRSSRPVAGETPGVLEAIRARFPLGFLSEEDFPTGDTSGIPDDGPAVDWPWSDNGARSWVGRIHLCEHESARAELYALETALASQLGVGDRPTHPGKRNDEETDSIHNELLVWLDEFLSPEGLFVPDPWRTHAVLPPIFRIALAIDSQNQCSRLQEALTLLTQAALRTAWWRGWLHASSGAGPSRGFLDLLGALQAELLERPWTTARRVLWEKEKPSKSALLPDGGFQSDVAAAAVLRRDWTVGGPIIAVDHTSPLIQLECRIFGEAVFAGPWRSRVWVDGATIELDGAWEPTCWFQDPDAEYLELRLSAASGVIIERQIFLAKKVALIWLSDTVTMPAGPEPAATRRSMAVEWELTAPAVTALTGQLPTRAQKLVGPKFDARLMPVGLPATPLAQSGGGTHGRLSALDHKLVLRTESAGTRVFAPLALTWAARSLPPPTEWKALSITNDRRRVGPDEAVAFRVPVADTQVVFFRALERSMRYAFLGHQTYSECEIGEFDRRGNFSEWLTVSG